MIAPPQVVPVDRLVATAEKVAKEQPEKAVPFYMLARIHYLAFSTKRDQVAVQSFKENEAVNVGSRSLSRMFRTYNPPNAPKPGVLDTAQLFSHASAAKANFAEAIKLEPTNALYELGLATLLDEVRAFVGTVKPNEVSPTWTGLKTADVRKAYAAAFNLALKADQAVTSRPQQGLEELMSYEAGKALIGLAEAEPASLTAPERAKVDEAKAALAKFEKLPPPLLRAANVSQPARFAGN